MAPIKIIKGASSSFLAGDMIPVADAALFNEASGLGAAIDKRTSTVYMPNELNINFAALANMYQYWLPRKMVDLVPNEATRKGWIHVCPSMKPEQIKLLEKMDRKYKVVQNFNKAWKWERLFGGSLLVYLFDQSQGLYSEALKKENIRKGSLVGIDVYDPWQAYPANIELTNFLDPQYRKPVNYMLGTPGYMMVSKGASKEGGPKPMADGAIIHHTRLARFSGLPLPWMTQQLNWYWGQSLLASVYDTVLNSDLVSSSVAQLLYKLSIPVFKVPNLTAIVSDPVAREAFLSRMAMMNNCMSNSHMAIIDKEEELSNLEQSGISAIDAIIERFYVLNSAASGIPVSKLVGESAKGLNATGEGDEKNFYDAVESDREDHLRQPLEEFYDIFFPAVMGIPRPDDHEIQFPPLFQERPEAKATRQNAEVGMLSLLYNDGAINKRIYIEEVMEREIVGNITEEDKAEIMAQTGTVGEDGEDDGFGGGGGDPTGESGLPQAEAPGRPRVLKIGSGKPRVKEDVDAALELGGSGVGDGTNPYAG